MPSKINNNPFACLNDEPEMDFDQSNVKQSSGNAPKHVVTGPSKKLNKEKKKSKAPAEIAVPVNAGQAEKPQLRDFNQKHKEKSTKHDRQSKPRKESQKKEFRGKINPALDISTEDLSVEKEEPTVAHLTLGEYRATLNLVNDKNVFRKPNEGVDPSVLVNGTKFVKKNESFYEKK